MLPPRASWLRMPWEDPEHAHIGVVMCISYIIVDYDALCVLLMLSSIMVSRVHAHICMDAIHDMGSVVPSVVTFDDQSIQHTSHKQYKGTTRAS